MQFGDRHGRGVRSVADPTSPRFLPRPRTVVCHICGREFGSASIDIHIPQCEKKWLTAEARKPAAQRRPVPQRPELEPGMSREEANSKLTRHWNDEVLEPCPHCGRTFLPDRLEVHLRSCQPNASGFGGAPSPTAPPTLPKALPKKAAPKTFPRPKCVVCHICGREFGSASIDIHTPQCERKWKLAEAQKPAAQRRPVPKQPELDPGLSREEANEKLGRHWNDEVLEPCPNCGRTFLPDRLEVHARSCQPKEGFSMSKTAPSLPLSSRDPPAAPKTFPRPKTVVCHICGREFGSASIDIHKPQCEKKWMAAEALKPAAQRRPVPLPPELASMSREEANEKLTRHWNEEVLEPCPNCGRTFLPDRLEVHVRSCQPKGPINGSAVAPVASPRLGPAEPTAAKTALKPRTIVCHICGREFGSASIDIHIPQCEKKWLAAEAQKPAGHQRPAPQRPQLDPDLSREEANEQLSRHWNDEVLEPCPNCGRTFLPDRLHVHLRSCKPKEQAP